MSTKGAVEVSGDSQTNYHTVTSATVTFLESDRQPFYFACPEKVEFTNRRNESSTRKCNKKCEQVNGRWRCGGNHFCERVGLGSVIRLRRVLALREQYCLGRTLALDDQNAIASA